MTTTPVSAALVPITPVFTNTERLALAGFLAGYSGLTREAYELDLRQYASWCRQHHLRLFEGRRADIECFARDLEARGRAPGHGARAAVRCRGFYRYAVEEELLDHSPAAHVRRPQLDMSRTRWSPSRSRRGPRGRSTWPLASAARARSSWLRTIGGWTAMVPPGSSAR